MRVELVYYRCVWAIIGFLLFWLQFLYVGDIGGNLNVFENEGVVKWVVLDYVHLLESFTDVYIVRYDFVGHCEAFGREKLRAIFELIDLEFPP